MSALESFAVPCSLLCHRELHLQVPSPLVPPHQGASKAEPGGAWGRSWSLADLLSLRFSGRLWLGLGLLSGSGCHHAALPLCPILFPVAGTDRSGTEYMVRAASRLAPSLNLASRVPSNGAHGLGKEGRLSFPRTPASAADSVQPMLQTHPPVSSSTLPPTSEFRAPAHTANCIV